MGNILDFPGKNYKRWAILQRLNELKKALIREWTQQRQDEFDSLKRDLDS